MQGEPLPAASCGVGQLPGVDVYGQTVPQELRVQ